MLKTTNPATNELAADYAEMTPAEIEHAIQRARRAQGEWARVHPRERASRLESLAELLRGRAGELSELISLEMGKAIREARAEIEKCARVCLYYAENAPRMLESRDAPTEAARSYVAFRPLGIVLAVMPWNFPFWQVFRFAAPTLAAGNGALLKHSSHVTGCALAIEQLIADTGVPEGLFGALRIHNAAVPAVIRHPAVAAVSLTGSTQAGAAVGACAGEYLKKSVLELGGSDPYVILADADVDAAAAICARSRLINAGQSCIAAKRMIVVESQRRRFEDALVAAMNDAVVGAPLDEHTDVGPLARVDLRDQLHDQVLQSVAYGARILLGGELPDPPGAWYHPTVLTDVGPGMPAYDEEVFGPVAAVIAAADERAAIELANDSPFGLGAAVFTRDVERGRALAEHALHAGSCFVNDLVRSDPRLPFGGVKHSGYGRELADFGLYEFVNIKSVYVGRAG